MLRQLAVEETVVGREKLTERQVLLEDVPEEILGLLAHGALQVIPIVGQEVLGGRHLADIIEFEPDPREVAHEALPLRVGKHTFHLLDVGSQVH